MKNRLGRAKSIVSAVFALGLAVVALEARPAAAGSSDAYKKMPGYVDFERMGIFTGRESTVDVFLKDPLIKLAQKAVEHEDPDLADMLSKIKFVRVQVFDIEGEATKDILDRTKALSEQLEKKGWEIIVRVRERDEHTYVYLLPGKNEDIDGLVVMSIEDDDEATFVNIVGNIDPEQIGRIGRSFDLDALEDFNMKIHIDDDEDDDDEPRKKRSTR